MSLRAEIALAFLIAGFGSMSAPAAAQATLISENEVILGETRQFVLRSKKLGRDMRITVAAPSAGGQVFRRAHSQDVKLPAIYALDNGWEIAGPIAQMMSNVGAMSPAYVVSIAYAGVNMREADFTFIAVKQDNHSFGDNGENLLAFLTDELRPFLASRYPIDPSQSVLFGHSLGGLFTATVLARKPDTFSGYIIGSAPLQFDPSIVSGLAATSKRGAGKRVFIAAGDKEEANVVEGVSKMAAALGDSSFKVEKRLYPNEGHISFYARWTPEAFAFVLPQPVRYDDGVKLTASELDRIPGVYRTPDGRVFTFLRDGEKLIARMTGIPGQSEIKAASAAKFFIQGYDSVIEFDLPASGPATGAVMRFNGVELRATRQ